MDTLNDAAKELRKRPDIEKILGIGKEHAAPWFRRNRVAIVAAAAALFGLFVYMLFGASEGNTVRYTTEPATRGDLIVIVTATGSVQPINTVDVSSELSGTIRKVLVDYNSSVKQGQALAELDTDKLQATVDSSEARVAAAEAKVGDAEATLDEMRLDFERKRELAGRSVASQHDLEAAKASYHRAIAAVKSAKADVAAAKADLKLNKTNLAKACICSPINGVVLSRNVEPGQTVASNLQAPVLFTLAEDLSKMEVQVDVDEADVGQVKEGQPATFTVDAYPDKVFNARIREVRYGSETVQGVVTYKAVLETENNQMLLRPGMTATAEIRVKELEDVVSIPNAALRFAPPATDDTDNRSLLRRMLPGPPRMRRSSPKISTGPEREVYVLENGEAKKVAITIGPTDGRRTQVLKGEIAPDEPVIVDTATNEK